MFDKLDGDRRARGWRAARLFATALAIACVVALVPAAHAQKSRLNGTVVDLDGNPVGGITLVFEPGPGTPELAQKVKVNKKGKFNVPFFPSGSFKLNSTAGEYYVKTMNYQLKDMNNVLQDDMSGDGHPVDGFPAFRAAAGMRVVLELIVAPESERERLKQSMGVSAVQEELKAAIAKLEADDLDGALAEVTTILESNPDIGAAHYVRGEALRRMDDLDGAEAAFRRAQELDPSQTGVMGSIGTVQLARGDALRDAGDADAAQAAYREALESIEAQLVKTPGDLPSLTNRAVVVERLGDEAGDDAALAALEAVVEASPDNFAARLRLSDMYTAMGRGTEAFDVLSAAPSQDVDLARAFFNMAVAEFNAGNIASAIAAAVKSSEIEPTLADPYRLLGRAYLGENRRPEAIESLKRFLEIAPGGTDTSAEQQILKALEADAAGS